MVKFASELPPGVNCNLVLSSHPSEPSLTPLSTCTTLNLFLLLSASHKEKSTFFDVLLWVLEMYLKFLPMPIKEKKTDFWLNASLIGV